MTPREATTTRKILSLQEDNYPPEADKYSILVSADRVSIHQPRGGAFMSIPRKEFDALVDWYQRDQTPNGEAI